MKRLEVEKSIEIEGLCEDNGRKLAKAKLHEIEQIIDVSHASQDHLDEVQQTNLDIDSQRNRGEQWVRRSTSHCDQPLLGGDTGAEEETRTGVTAIDNQPYLPTTSNELMFLQTQSGTQQQEFYLLRPLKVLWVLQQQCLWFHQVLIARHRQQLWQVK